MKKGLLVGINYIGTSNELSGCINDVNNLKNLLIDNKFYDAQQLCVMTDSESVSSTLYPSKQNMINQMNMLVDYANNCGTDQKVYLFFSYSGHGSYLTDYTGDEIDGRDEVLCPVDCQRNGYIIDDFIRTNLIDKLGSNVTLLVLIDACHSGTVLDLRYTYKCDGSYRCDPQNNINETRCNVIMISGCRDDQTSADAYIATHDTWQGAMTAAFLANYTKTIKTEDLIINMRKWLVSGGYDQVPQLSTGQIINTKSIFPLTPYANTSAPVNQQLSLIVSAFYGKGSKIVNVTNILKQYFTDDHSILIISNHLFGDPCVGFVKELKLKLSSGMTRVFRENQTITLNDIIGESVSSKVEQIKSAYYGKNNKWINVVGVINKYFMTNQSQLKICNQIFGEPCFGIVKELKIVLLNSRTKIFKENTLITLEQIIQ